MNKNIYAMLITCLYALQINAMHESVRVEDPTKTVKPKEAEKSSVDVRNEKAIKDQNHTASVENNTKAQENNKPDKSKPNESTPAHPDASPSKGTASFKLLEEIEQEAKLESSEKKPDALDIDSKNKDAAKEDTATQVKREKTNQELLDETLDQLIRDITKNKNPQEIEAIRSDIKNKTSKLVERNWPFYDKTPESKAQFARDCVDSVFKNFEPEGKYTIEEMKLLKDTCYTTAEEMVNRLDIQDPSLFEKASILFEYTVTAIIAIPCIAAYTAINVAVVGIYAPLIAPLVYGEYVKIQKSVDSINQYTQEKSTLDPKKIKDKQRLDQIDRSINEEFRNIENNTFLTPSKYLADNALKSIDTTQLNTSTITSTSTTRSLFNV